MKVTIKLQLTLKSTLCEIANLVEILLSNKHLKKCIFSRRTLIKLFKEMLKYGENNLVY